MATLGEIKDFKDQVLNSAGPVSREEMSTAFRQVLEQGVQRGVQELSEKDAFLAHPEFKIDFPDEAKKLEKKLKRLGFDSICERFEASLNTAAEEAIVLAQPVFKEAIMQLSFQDVVGLLKGSSTAVTDHLRLKTEGALIEKFKPLVSEKLQSVSATKYWSQAISLYNKVSSSKISDIDLDEYVTLKAVESLFGQIAKEEQMIRKDPKTRTTEIMRKVFKHQD